MKIGLNIDDAEPQLPSESQTLKPASLHLVVDPAFFITDPAGLVPALQRSGPEPIRGLLVFGK